MKAYKLNENQPNGLKNTFVFMLYFYKQSKLLLYKRRKFMAIRNKFWFVLIGAILGFVVIACSCSALNPLGNKEPMPGLAGKWLDPDTTGTYHVIAWQNNEYVVTQTLNPDRPGNEVTSSTWANGVLTWTYCVPNAACVTTKTVSLSGDNLDTTWENDQGQSGTTTMTRMP
jgi:hypothetical protein